ncbi:uncharacterized protein LOC117172817 [Belonocnema kinseyi]|uniref:uncharacterized protein LOC117172817 n=1 Tax=Belonocnema kinseyi TaxID=2817044 RepID=UPI00143D13F3|nr:uncharacterized protein LOC117172817 [Belonocnema kinseyi]
MIKEKRQKKKQRYTEEVETAGLLGGVEYRVKAKGRKVVDGEEEIENDISRDDVNVAIARLKREKATGKDGLENEALKYGGSGVREKMWGIRNKVWEEEGWPEEWKTGLLVPLIKKVQGKKVYEYRGITLMSVGYKMYAEVLRRRLERQLEEKGSIPQNKTGFSKGVGTIDNVYVFSYLLNRNLGWKKGKLVALFVDFKTAFDSVKRSIL